MITIATTVLTALLGLCFGVLGTLAMVWRLPSSRIPMPVGHAVGEKPPYVVDLDARNRWESVDPALLHEVNREEFEVLLARALADGVRSLDPIERAFLDRMVESERSVRVARARSARRAAARLRADREGRRLQVTGLSPSPFTHSSYQAR
jgi:hypothetical protein